MKPTPLLPGLNGIRAICALFILLGHIRQTDFCKWSESSLLLISLPICCAYFFFVLSGFLAGYKFIPGMSISTYYRKRAQRILPLYYGYILVCVVAFWWLGRLNEVLNPTLLYYLFLAPGVPFSMANGILPMVHLWFVGTVVLFYAVFPWFTRIREEDQIKVAGGFAIGWALLKWGVYLVVGKDTFGYRFASVTSFDCLFLGVLLGLMWKRKDTWVVKIGENRLVAILVWPLFLLSGIYGHFIPAPVRIEYMAVLEGLLILNQVSIRPLLSFENKVLNWIGSISYEIYVVQILVIMLLSLLYNYVGWQWPAWVIYSMCTIVVLVVAISSKRLLGLAIRYT